MFEKHMSATAANLVMLTAATLVFAGQPGTRSSARGADPALWPGRAEPAVMCHMPVVASERYGRALSRTLYESEMALLVPYDAPECAG